jgi:hypothetical protein
MGWYELILRVYFDELTGNNTRHFHAHTSILEQYPDKTDSSARARDGINPLYKYMTATAWYRVFLNLTPGGDSDLTPNKLDRIHLIKIPTMIESIN